jgi:hypothetical protein
MKKVIFIVLLIIPTLMYGESVSIGIETLKESNLAADEHLLMTEFLGSFLSDYDQLAVIEDEYIEDVLSEQKFSLSGFSDEDSIEIGKLINADYLLSGTLGLFALDDYFISLKLLNIEKGSLEATINQRFSKLENGINSMSGYLSELFEPVVSLSKKEIAVADVSKIVRGSWYYNRSLVGIGASYGQGQTVFESSTTTVHSLGLNITGVIGANFLFIFDTSLAYPLAVTGSSIIITNDFVNRLLLDFGMFPGYRFHFTEQIAIAVGLGISFRAKYISKDVTWGDPGNTLLTGSLGPGAVVLLEYYLSRNLAIQAGTIFVYEFLHFGSDNLYDLQTNMQSYRYGLRLQPRISISINQTSLRENK